MSKKNRDRNSFRKNPIDDISDMKKEESISRASTDTLKSIDGKLDSLQAASELGSEATESGFNKLTEQVRVRMAENTATLDDLVASNEMVVDVTNDGFRKLNRNINVISNKLSNIYKVLSSGIKVDNQSSPTAEDSTSDTLPAEPQPPVNPNEPFGPPSPFPAQPNNNNGSGNNNNGGGNNNNNNPKPKSKPKPKKPDERNSITNTLSVGFKNLAKSSDQIGKLLLGISVAATLNVAKTALMITAIIFVADVIRMKFEYMEKLITTNFKGFTDKFGELSKLLGSAVTAFDNIDTALKTLSGSELAKAIGNSLLSVMKSLYQTLDYELGKLLVSVTRMIPGMGKHADDLEAENALAYQRTGGVVSDEEAKKAAAYEVKNRKDNSETGMRKKFADSPFGGIPMSSGVPESQRPKDPDFTTGSDEDNIAKVQKMEALRSNIVRDSDQIDNSSALPHEQTAASLKEDITSINQQYNDLSKISPDAAAEIKPMLDDLMKKYRSLSSNDSGNQGTNGSPKAAPDDPKNSKTYSQEKTISQAQNISKRKGNSDNAIGTHNTNMTNVKNTNITHRYHVDAKTSSPAPGTKVMLGTQ